MKNIRISIFFANVLHLWFVLSFQKPWTEDFCTQRIYELHKIHKLKWWRKCERETERKSKIKLWSGSYTSSPWYTRFFLRPNMPKQIYDSQHKSTMISQWSSPSWSHLLRQAACPGMSWVTRQRSFMDFRGTSWITPVAPGKKKHISIAVM